MRAEADLFINFNLNRRDEYSNTMHESIFLFDGGSALRRQILEIIAEIANIVFEIGPVSMLKF